MFRASKEMIDVQSKSETDFIDLEIIPDDVEIPKDLESAHPGRFDKGTPDFSKKNENQTEQTEEVENELGFATKFEDVEVVDDVPEDLEDANSGRWEKQKAHEAEVEEAREKAFEAYDKTPPQESTISGSTFSWSEDEEDIQDVESSEIISQGGSAASEGGIWGFFGKAFSFLKIAGSFSLKVVTGAFVTLFDILFEKKDPHGKR